MEFSSAVDQRLPLQIRIPDRRNPLTDEYRCLAEVFIADTRLGPAVIWLEPFWHESDNQRVAGISYSAPSARPQGSLWIDDNPSFGPHCIAYQRPFVIEQLTAESPLWRDYLAWRSYAVTNQNLCSAEKAWQRAAEELAEIKPKCLAPTGILLPDSSNPRHRDVLGLAPAMHPDT